MKIPKRTNNIAIVPARKYMAQSRSVCDNPRFVLSIRHKAMEMKLSIERMEIERLPNRLDKRNKQGPAPKKQSGYSSRFRAGS